MPVTYSIGSNLLLMTAAGEYEPQDLPRTFLAALNDPACPAHVALLLDVRPSSMLATRSMDDIRAIGQFLGPYAERIGGRCAVVTGTEVQYGLGRMGSIYMESVGVEAGIFRDMESAMEWLNTRGPVEK
jgi:hypothetical protein